MDATMVHQAKPAPWNAHGGNAHGERRWAGLHPASKKFQPVPTGGNATM